MALPSNIQHDLELMHDADTGRAMKNYICQTVEDLAEYADDNVAESKSYAVGGTGTREGEDTDNSRYYYQQIYDIYGSLGGTLRPMGTITFSELPTSNLKPGYMYNISNAFTSDDRFKDGGGKNYPSGTDVYWTADSMWDCLAGGLNELEATLRADIKSSLDAIAADVESAHTDATNAANSASAASTSQTKAKTSETNAKTSETNAASSATDAASYRLAAQTSETNAKTSETNAAKSENAAKTSETNTKTSETNAKTSETNAKTSETNAKTSETNAASSASDAAISASNAAKSEVNAGTSEVNAANSAKEAADKVATIEGKYDDAIKYANKAESYAVGNDTREGDATDNAKYYYEQVKSISTSLKGALLPMGTVTFAELSNVTTIAGYMYNVSDAFTSDSRFVDGSGLEYPAGTNVYVTSDLLFDCLSGSYNVISDTDIEALWNEE